MSKDKIIVHRVEARTYEVSVEDVPSYIDDVESWAKNQALINTSYADLLFSDLRHLRLENGQGDELTQEDLSTTNGDSSE